MSLMQNEHSECNIGVCPAASYTLLMLMHLTCGLVYERLGTSFAGGDRRREQRDTANIHLMLLALQNSLVSRRE